MFPRRKRPESDFQSEIESHLQIEIDRLRAEGASAEEASASARRIFGNVTSSRERFYEASHWRWLDHLIHDLQYALRTLNRTPAFTAAAIRPRKAA